MKTHLLLSLLVCSLFAFPAAAQDSKYRPTNQQIPVPDCLNVKGLWDAGSKVCTLEEHKAWLADITHWRKERLIRIGYDGFALRSAGAAVDAIEFHAAADDGAGPLLL